MVGDGWTLMAVKTGLGHHTGQMHTVGCMDGGRRVKLCDGRVFSCGLGRQLSRKVAAVAFYPMRPASIDTMAHKLKRVTSGRRTA